MNNLVKTEEEQLAAVEQDGRAIIYIENPSEKIQLASVKKNWWAIIFNNSSEAVQLAAVKQNSYAIRHIKNPTKKVKAVHLALWVL